MPKRPHTSENKENEPEQDAVVANDPIPAKRIKTNDEPLQVQNQVQVEEEPMQFTDEEDETDDDETEEEAVEDCEGEGDPIPISDVLLQNEGAIHPTFKQYFAYEGTDLGMVSKTARFWSRRYLKVFPHVNPDVYDMYVHNDFVCYGEVEIVENCLLDLAKGTFLKHKGHLNGTHQLTAFRRLEALTIVLEHADNLPGIDDGERFFALTRVIGACYVSILASISPKSLFHGNFSDADEMRQLRKFAHQLPNFKQVIQRALIRAYFYANIGGPQTAYINVLKTIYCNWSLAIEQVRIDPTAKPAGEDECLWRALQLAATVKRGAFKESFNFLLELDTYAKMNPGLGGNAHDLRKWSKARRQQYSFDNEESEPATNFWFRL